VAGGLMAHHSRILFPDAFTLLVSIDYLAMIIIGGMGSILGSIFGAVFMTLLPEVLKLGDGSHWRVPASLRAHRLDAGHRLRSGRDPLPDVRAPRTRAHLAADQELFHPVAVCLLSGAACTRREHQRANP